MELVEESDISKNILLDSNLSNHLHGEAKETSRWLTDCVGA